MPVGKKIDTFGERNPSEALRFEKYGYIEGFG